MPSYAVAGLTIASERPLPELPEALGRHADWIVEVASRRSLGDFPVAVHEVADPRGGIWLVIRRYGDRYLLRFPGVVDFVVVPSEGSVACAPERGADESTVRHLLVDQVVPHILAMDGSLVLHASAIAVDDKGVAFIGSSGAGKSSLAAAFAGLGFGLLADDFLLLREHARGFLAVPSYSGLRLWSDSAGWFAGQGRSPAPVGGNTEKQRLVPPVAPEVRRPRPLVAVVVLGDAADGGAAASLTRLHGPEAFMAIFEQAFRLERSGRDRQLAEFDRFAHLAGSTTAFSLKYPRDYEALPEVCAVLLRALHDIDRSTGPARG